MRDFFSSGSFGELTFHFLQYLRVFVYRSANRVPGLMTQLCRLRRRGGCGEAFSPEGSRQMGEAGKAEAKGSGYLTPDAFEQRCSMPSL